MYYVASCAVKHDPATYIEPAVEKTEKKKGPVLFSASIIVDVQPTSQKKRSWDDEDGDAVSIKKLKLLPSSSSSSVLRTYKQLFTYCKVAFEGKTVVAV